VGPRIEPGVRILSRFTHLTARLHKNKKLADVSSQKKNPFRSYSRERTSYPSSVPKPSASLRGDPGHLLRGDVPVVAEKVGEAPRPSLDTARVHTFAVLPHGRYSPPHADGRDRVRGTTARCGGCKGLHRSSGLSGTNPASHPSLRTPSSQINWPKLLAPLAPKPNCRIQLFRAAFEPRRSD